MRENLTLSELQKSIKEVLEDKFFRRVWVRCEIYELKVNYSGHCYMNLVEKGEDEETFVAKASGIVWNSRWKLLSAYFRNETGKELAAGMNVLAEVQVQYSELYGLSLIIHDIDPAYTVGGSEMMRLKTINRLKEEGMFDMNASLTLPRLPRRFALVSSPTAAGYGDFMKHLTENGSGFLFHVRLYSAPMQGDAAPAGIIAVLDKIMQDMDEGGVYDAVLLVRGGGAVADLACFDDYDLAAHIAQFPIPVMTAIGHDRDFHICDMTACVSVKTPTALADFIINLFVTEDAMLASLSSRLRLALNGKFREAFRKGDGIFSVISSAVKMRYANEHNRLDRLGLRIKNGNPREKMKSGYSPVFFKGGILLSAGNVKIGDEIAVMLKDGIVKCIVNQIEKREQ